jgi:hypothetical protein
MKNQLKLCLKTAWVTSLAVTLLMGVNVCSATNAACAQSGEIVFFWTCLLSFPTGIVFLLASTIFIEKGPVFGLEFMIAWTATFIGGFVQWFVIVPNFFAKNETITLGLHSGVPQEPTPTAIQTKPIVEMTRPRLDPVPETASRAQPSMGKRIRPITAFDRYGRTPLERVIRHL